MKLNLKITALALAALVVNCAHAGGLYVYVDEQGVPHYALQPLNDKYQLFVSDAPGFSDDVKVVLRADEVMQAKVPDMSVYGKKSRGTAIDHAGMSLPNGIKIAAPSKAVLNRLLRSQALARYEPIINRHARAAGVDVSLVKAVMAAESGFNAAAVSPKNALGLMQVIPPTAARYGVTAEQLMQPERNIYAGVRYLADLSRMFKGRPELIIAAYNAGEGAVYKYNRQIPPYKETQNYVRTVLQFYSVYRPDSRVTTDVNSAAAPILAQSNNRRSAQRISVKVGARIKNTLGAI
ncbi:MAG: transglycosylase SLT domain-containing protein [Formosimonas sp.]